MCIPQTYCTLLIFTNSTWQPSAIDNARIKSCNKAMLGCSMRELHSAQVVDSCLQTYLSYRRRTNLGRSGAHGEALVDGPGIAGAVAGAVGGGFGAGVARCQAGTVSRDYQDIDKLYYKRLPWLASRNTFLHLPEAQIPNIRTDASYLSLCWYQSKFDTNAWQRLWNIHIGKHSFATTANTGRQSGELCWFSLITRL